MTKHQICFKIPVAISDWCVYNEKNYTPSKGTSVILHDEYNKPLVLNTLKDRLPTHHVWCLDLKVSDFKLLQIKSVEEIVSPSLVLKINGRLTCLPCHWHMLICDPETTQLDVVPVGELANDFYYALVYGNNIEMPQFEPITVIDYLVSETHIYPSHARNFMLCHDVGNGRWINCSYADSYNRFLKNKIAGDLIDY